MHSHELSLYAVEKDGPASEKRVLFNAIALRSEITLCDLCQSEPDKYNV